MSVIDIVHDTMEVLETALSRNGYDLEQGDRDYITELLIDEVRELMECQDAEAKNDFDAAVKEGKILPFCNFQGN